MTNNPWDGMGKEIYEHIKNNIHLLDLDLEKGIVLNRKAQSLRSGYRCQTLKYKMVQLHQILAVARWGEKCIGMTVNHINGCRTDNSWDNLELLSMSDNVKARKGYVHSRIKAYNIETGETFIFDSQMEAGRKLNLNQGNINSALKRKSKHHKGFIFERVGEIA